MLVLENLIKKFDEIVAVNEVSFTVSPGHIFGFLGPNGAGKTTTIRIIMDILKADSGTVLYNGTPTMPPNSQFGYLPEERGLYQKIPVKELLIYFARLRGMEKNKAGRKVDEYLERFDLGERRDTKVSELSKGNQQKIQFINAILHDPEFLILDEPFAGLDPVNQLLLKEILDELKLGGKTIILSSHQMDQVEKICDDIALINQGRLVVTGDLKSIKRKHGKSILEVILFRKEDRGHAVFKALNGGSAEGLIQIPFGSESEVQALIGKINRAVPVRSIRMAEAGLEDIFISLVRGVK